jgi:hypothetical protein
MSFTQERVWHHCQLDPDICIYNVPAAFHLRGQLNAETLRQALCEIVRRQESLRTRFATAAGETRQIVLPELNVRLRLTELPIVAEQETELTIQRLGAEMAQKPFDLAEGPLFRAELVRIREEEHVLLVCVHHIICDGWSLGVFFREFGKLYSAYRQGTASPFPELAIQHGDFAVWQRKWLEGEVWQILSDYWKEHLSGRIQALELPIDHPRDSANSHKGARQSVRLPSALCKALGDVSREHGNTLFTTLLATFKILLHSYTGQSDIIVCSPIAARNRAEVGQIIGYFNNLVVMRTDLSGNPTFREIAGRVQQAVMGAYSHQDLPFQKIADLPNLARTPLARSMFARNPPAISLPFEGIAVTSVAVDNGFATCDLSMFVRGRDEELIPEIEYRTDLFDADNIADMLKHFQVLLESIAGDSEKKLSSLVNSIPKDVRRPSARSTGMSRTARSEGVYVAPRTALEKALAEIWQRVLGKEKIGIYENFFEIGGHSLLAVRIINDIQEVLGDMAYTVALFDAPCIADLAEYLRVNYPQSVQRLCPELAPVRDSQSEQITEPPLGGGIDEAKIESMRELFEPRVQECTATCEERPPSRKNRQAVFILSPPRSGSTLLRVMLAGHSDLFSPPELRLLSYNTLAERAFHLSGRKSSGQAGLLRAVMQIKGCDVEEATRVMREYESRGLTTCRFYQVLQEWIGNKTLVDKSPQYAMSLKVLERAEVYFDNALYIHLVRHPLAMIRSFIDTKQDLFLGTSYRFSAREQAELFWLISHQNILEFLAGIPDHRHHLIRFEDLVRHSEVAVREACAFLGVGFQRDMLKPYEKPAGKMTDGVDSGSRMLGDPRFHQYQDIDPQAADKWKSSTPADTLNPATVRIAESFGYRRESLD